MKIKSLKAIGKNQAFYRASLSFTLFEEDPKKWLDYKLDKAIAALPEIEPRKKLHRKKEMREPFILRAISRKLRTLIG